MDLKKILLDFRKTRLMKGKYPTICYILPNDGGVASNKKGYFVMTLYNDKLYFHSLTRFMHKYNPKGDFAIELNKFDAFQFGSMFRSKRFSLISYKNDYLPIAVFSGINGSKESEVNLVYIIEALEKKGFKEIKDQTEEDVRKHGRKEFKEEDE